MSLLERVGRDPTVGGDEVPTVVGTGLTVDSILRQVPRLADGDAADIVAALQARQSDDARAVTVDDLRAAATYAADAVARQALSGPVRRALFEQPSVPSDRSLQELRDGARELMEAIAAGRDPARGGGGENEAFYSELVVAARYAVAAIKDQSLASAGSRDESLRDRLPRWDRALVEDYCAYLTVKFGSGRHSVSLESILESWQRLVEQVAEGFPGILDEYVRAVTVSREPVGRILGLVSAPGRAEILDHGLRDLDARFTEVTEPSETPLTRNRPDAWRPTGWWWFRVPGTPGPKLQADLEAAGITSG